VYPLVAELVGPVLRLRAQTIKSGSKPFIMDGGQREFNICSAKIHLRVSLLPSLLDFQCANSISAKIHLRVSLLPSLLDFHCANSISAKIHLRVSLLPPLLDFQCANSIIALARELTRNFVT
jgi:hypothetical protein